MDAKEIYASLEKLFPGKVGDLKFEKELIPVVTEPLKRLWKSLSGARASGVTNDPGNSSNRGHE